MFQLNKTSRKARLVGLCLVGVIVVAGTGCGSANDAVAGASEDEVDVPADLDINDDIDDLTEEQADAYLRARPDKDLLGGDLSRTALDRYVDFQDEEALSVTLKASTGKDEAVYDVTLGRLVLGTVLDDLGFKSSVYSRMQNTRALDGTQEAESDKATAYWTYHPDSGLKVIFESN